MSKIVRKYNLNAKGVLYVEDDVISLEDGESGELIPVASLLDDFNGKECTIAVTYSEDCE